MQDTDCIDTSASKYAASRKTKRIQERANEYYSRVFDDELRELIQRAEDGNDDACEELKPYCVVKYATGHWSETIEWHLELADGELARVVAITSLDGKVKEARFEFQDWLGPWTPATNQDGELVARYARAVGGFYGC